MGAPAADRATVHLADLGLHPNEASGLLRVGRLEILQHNGWDRAFWSVLDEVDAGECIALLGHGGGQDLGAGWSTSPFSTVRSGDEGRADDAEALARHDGWVYVFGSQHGGKDGPIRRREQWVARFREADVNGDQDPVELAVVRTRFLLHRLINDALHDSDLELLPMGAATRAAFISQTRDDVDGSAGPAMVRPDDWTINVEGAEFTEDGMLILGLRYPLTVDGLPLIVGLSGCDRLFEDGTPEVARVWSLDAVGATGVSQGSATCACWHHVARRHRQPGQQGEGERHPG